MPLDIDGAPTPRAHKRASTSQHHGYTLVDDYAWLKADNWQEVMRDPEQLPRDIRDYLEAENAYCETVMGGTQALQDDLFEELKGRLKPNDSSVPMKDGDYAYSRRFTDGAEYPLFVQQPRSGGEETIIFNGPKEAEGFDYFALGHVQHSPDHRKLAWSVDSNGSEFYRLKLRDLDSGQDAEQAIEDVGGFEWCPDSTGFVYVKVDETHRPNKVYFRDADGKDHLIFEETDTRFYVGINKSLDGQWLLIHTGQNDEDEVHFVKAEDPLQPLTLVAPRRAGHEYSVDLEEQTLFITTNCDDATNFKLMTANVEAPTEENWADLVPHRDDVLLDGCIVFKNYLIRQERENALPRIVVRDRRTAVEHTVAFEEEAYSIGVSAGYEFDSDELQFTYSSPSTPAQVWDYHLDSRERTLRKEQEIPSGHNSAHYVVRRLQAPAEDGELVPLTILHHVDTALDGSAPCLLYGYGSYGAGMPANFSPNRLSLVDRGFVFCVAHIRGGDEKGRHWYEQTKKSGKTKTFKDFLAAAQHLASEKFTSRGNIVAMGGSAGGMLMGACVNMDPELFAGIIAQVPFVDVLNTMLDDSLPLTPGEWSQWGNPIESREEFEFIHSYSPYDNVSDQSYPPIFALGGLTDPRVQYWEPSKWVAKLREKTDDRSLILLKTNMGSGHFGKTGRYAYLEEVALIYAFALNVAKNTKGLAS